MHACYIHVALLPQELYEGELLDNACPIGNCTNNLLMFDFDCTVTIDFMVIFTSYHCLVLSTSSWLGFLPFVRMLRALSRYYKIKKNNIC